jgi:hypothetical protein
MILYIYILTQFNSDPPKLAEFRTAPCPICPPIITFVPLGTTTFVTPRNVYAYLVAETPRNINVFACLVAGVWIFFALINI